MGFKSSFTTLHNGIICGVTHFKIKMEKNLLFKNGNLMLGKMKIIKKKIPSCNTEEWWSEQKN